MRKSVLITGADRGLGFALVKEFLAKDYLVYAGRFMLEWKELDEVKEQYPDTLRMITLDVSDTNSVEAAYELISKEITALDMLINNAGIAGFAGDISTLENVEKGLPIFNVNCVGVIRMVRIFLPLLEKGEEKRLCFVSSEAGSISVCHRNDGFIYPMSKAALNMTVRLLFEELQPQGYTFRLYHPGWVRSYMLGKKNLDGIYEPEETAASAVKLFLDHCKQEDVLKMVDNESRVWPF